MTIKTTITINKLELNLSVGCTKEERLKKQIVLIDIHIRLAAAPRGCITDQLEDTHCYDNLIQHLKETMRERQFRLIEHMGYEIYQTIKKRLPAETSITICVTKKPAITHLIDGVSFYYGDSV